MKSARIFVITACLLLGLGLWQRVHTSNARPDLYIDEALSSVLSEYNHYGWDQNLPLEVLSGSALRSLTMWNDPSLKDSLEDLRQLRRNNRDSPHTNLYYSLLSLWHTGFIADSWQAFLQRALSLNLVLWTLGFICICTLSFKLSANPLLQLSLPLLSAFNPGAVGNSFFIRPYALQEAAFAALALSLYFAVHRLRAGSAMYAAAVPAGIAAGICLLSGYFAIPAVMLAVLMILSFGGDRILRRLQLVIMVLITAAVIVFIVYPPYLNAFSGDRGAEAEAKLNLWSLLSRAPDLLPVLAEQLTRTLSLPLLIGAVCGLLLGLKSRRQLSFNQAFCLTGGSAALIWIIGIFFLEPYPDPRYTAAAYPLLCLLPLLLISLILHAGKLKLSAAALLCMAVPAAAASLQHDRLVHFDTGMRAMVKSMEQAAAAPLNLIYEDKPWKLLYLTPFLSAERDFVMISSCRDLKTALSRYQPRSLMLDHDYGLKCYDELHEYAKKQAYKLILFNTNTLAVYVLPLSAHFSLPARDYLEQLNRRLPVK